MTSKNPYEFGKFIPVRLKQCGKQLELMMCDKWSRGGTTRKLDNDNYLDIRSGEVKQFKHIENRQQDINNVAKSISSLRDLINANCDDISKCKWLTLTYAENMQDAKRLYKDYQAFVRRARDRFGHFEYIIVAEPQGRGAWHLHCILIFEAEAPFMENELVRNDWRQGFVNVQNITNIDNIGLYVTAYLTNMDLQEAKKYNIEIDKNKIETIEINGKSKRVLKGARLFMYPPKFNLYRFSKGIKKPIIEKMTYSEAKKKIGSGKPTYTRNLKIPMGDTSNSITYEYYNLNRNEKQ